MNIIHALHHQTDQLVGFLTNEGVKMYWDDTYVHDLSGEHSFDFTMSSMIEEAKYFDERARFLIPSEDIGFEEFIVFESHTIDDEKTIYGIASYSDMEKQFILAPGTYSGTVKELAALVLPDTEWQEGELEYSGIRTIVVEKEVGAYSFLLRIASAFDVELRFRVETSGNKISGRYVDVLESIGADNKKEIELGKDLISIEKKVNNERIVTALYCVGPERDDGTRLTLMVTNEEAFQRWNRNGKHLIDIYEPQSSDRDMTLEKLEQYGDTELKKRIASVVDYYITAASLETLFPHEKVRTGDRLRIKDPEFSPPLYAEARAIRIEGSKTDTSAKFYKIGEVVTYSEDEIMSTFRRLQLFYGTRVIKSPTPPAGDSKIIWIKTEEGSDFEVAHTWNGSEWIPITPTRAEQIGAETPEGAQEKAELERIQGQATQLSKERTVNEGVYTKLMASFALREENVRDELEDAFTEYSARYNNLYAAIAIALMDSKITDTERAQIELGTEYYRIASMRFEEAITDAFEDISSSKAKDAEIAATGFTESFAQKKVTQSSMPPDEPALGDLWIDTSQTPNVWKRWNGAEWRKASTTTFEEMHGQVREMQIANDAITTQKLADLVITAEKLANGSIVAAKLDENAVTRDKIAPNAIGTSEIDAGAITEQKMKWSTHLIF